MVEGGGVRDTVGWDASGVPTMGELLRRFDALGTVRGWEKKERSSERFAAKARGGGAGGDVTDEEKSLRLLASERSGNTPRVSPQRVFRGRQGDRGEEGVEGGGGGRGRGWREEEMTLLKQSIEAGSPPWASMPPTILTPGDSQRGSAHDVVLALPSAHRRRRSSVERSNEEIHGHALASVLRSVSFMDGEGMYHEVRAGMAAEVCTRAAVQAYVGFGGDADKSKAMGRALAGDAVRRTGLSGDSALDAEAMVGQAVDCTVDFVARECRDLVHVARGMLPARVERAVRVGVRVAFAHLASLGCGVEGVSAEAAMQAAEKGQGVAQRELEAGAPRGRALLDLEAVAVWVALSRGITGTFTLENPPWVPQTSADGDWDTAERTAVQAALECIRGHYARPGAALELTAAEAARVIGGGGGGGGGGEAARSTAVVPGMDASHPLLQASRFFCATYVRWYYEHRGRAGEADAMDSAASTIQNVFRNHATVRARQQADARLYARAIGESRDSKKAGPTQMHMRWVVRLQANVRGRAARARVKALREHRQETVGEHA